MIVPPSGRLTDMSGDRAKKVVLDFEMTWPVWKNSYSASSFPEIPPRTGLSGDAPPTNTATSAGRVRGPGWVLGHYQMRGAESSMAGVDTVDTLALRRIEWKTEMSHLVVRV